MMLTVDEVNKHYEQIIHSNMSQKHKDFRLTYLITYLETEFDIPMIPHNNYNDQEKKAIDLLKKMQISRSQLV